MSFSLGVVIAQRKIPQSLWHRGLNQAYKSAKNAGRNRVCVQVIFNSGQTLEWVCPWPLWELLTTVKADG
jgi:CRISPR-associated protein Cmr2